MGTLVLCAMLLVPFVRQGSIILTENFNGATQGTYGIGPITGIATFTVTAGTIDVTGPAYFPGLCVGAETGNCVDLNGTGANPGQITSVPITIIAGRTYTLTFNLN